ncbi:MAG: ASKHA domain-containing protein [Lachnospiraceae bacterium]|nr:ASKHA domain-containing protein [Ruminococcus sp.]MCM1275868.1 ASKHA domain-containing protein [Lachnospiraceae bacterium]
MIAKIHITNEKYRAERSAELAAAVDITACSIAVVYCDLALKRRYARTALFGERITAANAAGELARLLVTSMRGYGIGASAVKSVGIAAPVHIESALERSLSADELYLPPETEIFFVPFISAGISGRFTAALLTLPEGDCVIADVVPPLCIAEKRADGIVCASFPLSGAFDGSGLESGMPAENGAIDAVRREKDGTIVYEVIGDGDSIGVSPCGAAMAVNVMRGAGVLDGDGIMTDRDLFYIGEDFFVSQSDVRVIQSDKARCRAVFELFSAEGRTFLSGEAFASENGLRALLELGALPESRKSAGFCRNAAEQGIIMCLEEPEIRLTAAEIARSSRDITGEILENFDKFYFDYLSF